MNALSGVSPIGLWRRPCSTRVLVGERRGSRAAPEIEPGNLGIGEQVGTGADEAYQTVLQNDTEVGRSQAGPGVLLHHENCAAGLGQLANAVEDALARPGIEPDRR